VNINSIFIEKIKYVFIFFIVFQFVFSQNTIDKNKYDSILKIAEKYEVWDPEPKKVESSLFGSSPSDAIILFDGSDFSKWHHSISKKPVEWTLNNDKSMTIKQGAGNIETKLEHGSIQLHVEWKISKTVKGEGQLRGNSGIYLQRRYEIQVLDSYDNRTYSNGQAGSIYKQNMPLVNASRPPGEWQSYDIIFNEPIYDKDGNQIIAGTVTILHNGILVQNNTKIEGTTSFFGMVKTKKDAIPLDGPKGGFHRSLLLQDHIGEGRVSYRNIWMRRL
tara:strand:+ start:136 stop:960 length:825 start_codon:yes stop_codon:yes gene_type:complete